MKFTFSSLIVSQHTTQRTVPVRRVNFYGWKTGVRVPAVEVYNVKLALVHNQSPDRSPPSNPRINSAWNYNFVCLLGVVLKSKETIVRSPSAETEKVSPWTRFSSSGVRQFETVSFCCTRNDICKNYPIRSPTFVIICVYVCMCCAFAFLAAWKNSRTTERIYSREPMESFWKTWHWRSLLKDSAKFCIH
jgi:hypothetical protein